MNRNIARSLTTCLAVAGTLVLPAPADAGTYRVYSCKTPTGQMAPIDGWTAPGSSLAYEATNDCAGGGPIAVRLSGDSGHAAGFRAGWSFTLPPELTLERANVWRSMSVKSGADVNAGPAAYIAWPSSRSTDAKDICASTLGCAAKGSHDNPWATTNLFATGSGAAMTPLYVAVGCTGSTGSICADRNSSVPMAEIRVHAFHATLVDATDPVPDSPTGPLTSPLTHKGVESIAFKASDTGAGIYRATIEVKRAGEADFSILKSEVLDPNGGRCQDAGADDSDPYEFLYVVPCSLWVEGRLELDTTTLPDGVHELRVRVEDASGNAADVHGPVAFEVDNVPPPGVRDPDGDGPADGMPSISGAPVVGSTLTGSSGAWSGDGNSYAFQWLRCTSATDAASCVPIDGAAAATYVVALGDLARFVRLRVTATNAQGSATATSAAVGPVSAASGAGRDPSGDPAGAGRDPSGDPASADDRSAVTPRTLDNGRNASDRAVIRLAGKRRRTLGFGRSTTMRATLRDEAGRPITGARVDVLQRLSVPGATWSPAREPLVTDGAGRLRWRVPAGAGRTLRIAYRASLADRDFGSTSDLVLVVRSKTSIRVSDPSLRNGERVRFLGRLLGRPVPPRGVLIDLQARVGRRWQTFQTTRTRRNGRWATGYRFRSTRGVQTYAFRARVRADSAYPFAMSRSRTVRVTVAG